MNRVLVFLDAIRDHLDSYAFPPVASVRVGTGSDPVSVQLDTDRLTDVARSLVVWADSLENVTASIWRVPHGGSVHLEVQGRTPCGIPVVVYGGVRFDEVTFPDLPAGIRQEMPVFVLRQWNSAGEVAA
ncbi:hypothetical protein SAMN04489729_5162 [Amycolatopsis lurida]|uniref:Uncharacterized protein n=1 Tax=Amycolatopsis lurida NRRL 2430 TaxID=1460371 RepID=A0A2P2FET2_AMYLU|nr:hypothetical protein [Amycolatopsis lurida]KFU75224.1 hypothetical protein BB31_42700 [Amycolatopsis lurida NRRL 2430]SED75798.1 hypothetical protein SAMN04489729_5162 [Amycolatopsis lurida]